MWSIRYDIEQGQLPGSKGAVRSEEWAGPPLGNDRPKQAGGEIAMLHGSTICHLDPRAYPSAAGRC